MYEPSAVVEEPLVATWRWGFWPPYEVEHHYIVNDEHVIIHDRHYFSSCSRTRPYIRNDTGKYLGWYRHGACGGQVHRYEVRGPRGRERYWSRK